MGAYDTERVNEVCVLMHEAKSRLPRWVGFQCDYPVEFKRIVHWLLTNSSSPLEWQRDGRPMHKAVVHWALRTRDGTIDWTTNVRASPVTGPAGRVGRIRLRKPRTSS